MHRVLLLVAMTSLVVPGKAGATLIGDTVGGDYSIPFGPLEPTHNYFRAPGDQTVGFLPAVVGGGPEFIADFRPFGGVLVTADFLASSLVVTVQNDSAGPLISSAVSFLSFNSLDWGGTGIITSFEVEGVGLPDSTAQITLDGTGFEIRGETDVIIPVGATTVTYVFATEHTGGVIPEPNSALLAMVSILVLGRGVRPSRA